MRLLLIEDNERFAALLKKGLADDGFTVDVIVTAEDARAALRTGRADIIVLDLVLPDADGPDGANRIGPACGHNAGADPYRAWQSSRPRHRIRDWRRRLSHQAPCALEELVARPKALLRRPGHLLGLSLKLGNLTLDTAARQVFVDDKAVTFSAHELAVLEHLLCRNGKVVTKSQLENIVYGPTQDVGSNAVEVHTHRLRRHLVDIGASVVKHT
jgi:DNA-binding response OmpR family regulator